MDRVQLSKRLDIAGVAIGTMNLPAWGLDEYGLAERIHSYVEEGLTTYDLADIYANGESETLFGKALKVDPGLRERIQIVTKGGIVYDPKRRPDFDSESYDLSKEHLLNAIDGSLRRLGVDHVDLYLLHRPSPLMDPADIADAVETIIRSGKATEIGVSNMLPEQISMLEAYTSVHFVTNEIKMNVRSMDFMLNGTHEDALRRGIPLMAFAPVYSGKLFRQDLSEEDAAVVSVLREIQEELGAETLDEVLYAWLYRLPETVVPVTGSGKAERVRLAVRARELHMSREQWHDIFRIAAPKSVLTKYHMTWPRR